MYDYVIVGAGSAGCVLAARLTEDPGVSVLLLEAGPPDRPEEIRIPAAAPALWKSRYAWDDSTVPQRHAYDRIVHWPHGRTLGGSSAINGMVYVRGNRLDYDTWRDRYGCTGWGYGDLLPYFRRAEDQQRGESAFHGVGGPLRVEDPRYRHPLTEAWVASAVASGLPANDDFNGAQQDGVGFFQLTQRAGARWSTADGYLRPALARPNLTVRTDAVVSKILVERGRATGVVVEGESVPARREVVLAAGAINSPKLLLLSGIGPAGQLRRHGIEPIVDAPVGEGLQDHPLLAPRWSTPEVPSHLEEASNAAHLARWRERRQGPLTSNGPQAGGFGRSRPGLPAPDIGYGAVASPGPDELLVDPRRRGVSLLVILVEVGSRGRVTLRSANPLDPPLVDPAYLAHESDLDALVTAVRQQREIAGHRPLAGYLDGEVAPGEQAQDDERLREWVRRSVTTVFHPTGTCPMGGGADAVCDPQLRVRGVAGLRVVDASVMPVIPRGNTNAPTIAIAERAADLISGGTPLATVEAAAVR